MNEFSVVDNMSSRANIVESTNSASAHEKQQNGTGAGGGGGGHIQTDHPTT